MSKIKIALAVVATLLITAVAPHGAHANELAIWDQLKGSNPKG